MKFCEIEKIRKTILGDETEYTLYKETSNTYSIEIAKGNDIAKADFYGNLFTVVKLFEIIFNTDTLPENLSDIACDIKNTIFV